MYNNVPFEIKLLSEILNCGYDDLDLLKNTEYDILEIYDQVKDYLSLETMVGEIVSRAIEDMKEDINEMKYDIFENIKHTTNKEEKATLMKSYSKLGCLTPSDDITLDFNYICSEALINSHKDIYQEFPELIENFETRSGINICI